MKIAMTGVTGYVGGQLLTEALSRPQIEVTALVRNPAALPAHERLRSAVADFQNVAALAEALRGHDALVHAFHPGRELKADDHELNMTGHRTALAAARLAGLPRLIAVGGAASLRAPDGVEYIESSLWDHQFDPYLPAIRITRSLYYLLAEEKALDWVMVAPSSLLRPGERTTRFRYGKDELLFDESGTSHISLEDYAFALIEEVVNPQHHRERFTVGY